MDQAIRRVVALELRNAAALVRIRGRTGDTPPEAGAGPEDALDRPV
ncbi:hypothetical protein [Streptomyces shenzhenensis]